MKLANVLELRKIKRTTPLFLDRPVSANFENVKQQLFKILGICPTCKRVLDTGDFGNGQCSQCGTTIQAGGPGSGCHGPNCGRQGHGSFARMMKRRETIRRTLPDTPKKILPIHKAMGELVKMVPHHLLHKVAEAFDYNPRDILDFTELLMQITEHAPEMAEKLHPALITMFGQAEQERAS